MVWHDSHVETRARYPYAEVGYLSRPLSVRRVCAFTGYIVFGTWPQGYRLALCHVPCYMAGHTLPMTSSKADFITNTQKITGLLGYDAVQLGT